MKIHELESLSESRRSFLQHLGLGATTALLAPLDLGASGGSRAKSAKIAFNSANLVARVSNYRFELSHWMEQHQKTVKATDEAAWRAICREIAACGFRAVEVWEAHASPQSLDRTKTMQWKKILQQAGLKPIGYGGQLSRETLQICAWLEIPAINGGLGSLTPENGTALCKEFGVALNLENHPEKSVEEILKKIDGGNQWLGVCIDMGWLGTQGASTSEVIKKIGPLVRHTHVKDVKAVGKHETCLLGEGVVNVAESIKTLRAQNYTGWYSWEDEPEDRNPFDSAQRNRQWIEKQLAG
jgi:sugar phosphate isomerase/epimerase